MRLLIIVLLFFAFVNALAQNSPKETSQIRDTETFSYDHPIPFKPKTYVAYFTHTDIDIDGEITDQEWGEIPWTDLFVDIEGQNKPLPFLDCRAKISWNEEYLLIAALMNEPHIWATLTERDAIMYHDDDFEVFIDPDGDGHNYFELEMNAFNAIWDLYMLYPYYMDNRRNYIMNWDIKGLLSAVHLDGSINDPHSKDQYWSVELAIPWETFNDFKKSGGLPSVGEQWRLNFSRVDWPMEIVDGAYQKKKDAKGKILAERNWVWSPTGYINMHKPETWGYVQFERDRKKLFEKKEEEEIKWALWQGFYQVKECWKKYKDKCDLIQMDTSIIQDINASIDLEKFQDGFLITLTDSNGMTYSLNHLGRLTSSNILEN